MPDGDHLKKVRVGDPFRPSAPAWNAFVDAARKTRRLSVGGAASAGRPQPKGGGSNVVIVKVTQFSTPVALGGGKYYGRILTGATTVVADTNNLAMPEGMTVPDADDALVLNIVETTSHYISNNTYQLGLVVGTSGDYTVVMLVGVAFAC